MRRGRRAALLVTVASLSCATFFAFGGAAAAATDPCELVTKQELERAFGTAFEVAGSDDTSCFWFSKVGKPGASVGVAASRLPAKAIAAGKRSQANAEGATEIRGVGDLAVYQTSAGEGGTTTINLLVFDGRTVGRVSGSVDGDGPSVAAMRKVARSLHDRM